MGITYYITMCISNLCQSDILHKHFRKHISKYFTFLRKLSSVFLTHVWIIHIISRTLYINTICMAGNIHVKGKSTYIEYYFASILVLLRHLDQIAENNELETAAFVS